MAKKTETTKKTNNLEGRFIVALPFVTTGVEEYNLIEHIGGTIATTPAKAVGNYLFRLVPHRARIILGILRDNYGGAGNYAMRVPDEFRDEQGNPLSEEETRIAKEIEICEYLERCHNIYDQRTEPRRHLDKARKLLEEFQNLRKA